MTGFNQGQLEMKDHQLVSNAKSVPGKYSVCQITRNVAKLTPTTNSRALFSCVFQFLLYIALRVVFMSDLQISKGISFIISRRSTKGEGGNRVCYQ